MRSTPSRWACQPTERLRLRARWDAVYAIALGMPADRRLAPARAGLHAASASAAIASVALLGGGEITWRQDATALEVKPPALPADAHTRSA